MYSMEDATDGLAQLDRITHIKNFINPDEQGVNYCHRKLLHR